MPLILSTDRLVLRPLEMADQDLVTALLTDERVMRYIRPPFTAEEVAGFMKELVKRGAKGAIGVWCVVEKATGERIGNCALMPMPTDQSVPDFSQIKPDRLPDIPVEVGYELLPAAWGRGYATEIAKCLVNCAFQHTELAELVACIDDPNEASRRVLKKAGLTETGPIMAYGAMGPGFRITRAEWEAGRRSK
ncbi:GNAT family N-acetyltransferase [Aestuariispira insulae]|uniref:RimJ/RimL family protein N-acetyltransferase n=1 Tax=Aestuariispira insulae TaxID=1461337 RepID=A0A3D9HGK0_9PROT|nr:GNAT family N-acetyltransferase [Aestuariispira insulae]RED48618.1 RimJ/RimL family protein N-acetyltransferase [Aestuariispira insulae]